MIETLGGNYRPEILIILTIRIPGFYILRIGVKWLVIVSQLHGHVRARDSADLARNSGRTQQAIGNCGRIWMPSARTSAGTITHAWRILRIHVKRHAVSIGQERTQSGIRAGLQDDSTRWWGGRRGIGRRVIVRTQGRISGLIRGRICRRRS